MARVENAEVARIFRELADLLEIQEANPFRVRAYRNAARTIEELTDPVAELAAEGVKRIDALPGIGEDLAEKVIEIVDTGSLSALEDARAVLPVGLVDLIRVRGLGPKRARALHEALGISSIEELGSAARRHRIRTVRGFGAKTEAKILEELERRAATGDEHRISRAVAAPYAESLLEYLRTIPGVGRVDVAGSFRRCRETVGDLDILVEAEPDSGVSGFIADGPDVDRVLEHGPTRSSIQLRSGLRVDIRVLPPESYGAGLHYFTGSKAHNIAVRRLGKQRGLRISEYGVFRGRKQIGGRTEEDVFAAVDLPWIPPELREARGEIDAARDDRLPPLVKLGDLRGDLQMHTTDSDGRDTLDAMADAAQTMGYEYISVTDHSPALRMIKGLDAAGFRRQRKRIERLNARLESLTVLSSAEVDIRPDGSLDLDDDALSAFDLVLVSIHSRFDLPEAQQTDRVLAALSHPAVHILGHPTGRLLGRRPAMKLDMEQILLAAADLGVIVEVNAQPTRLDLDDQWCRFAVEHGVRLAISTDAHAVAELQFMRWGVDQARRGWVEEADVVNTRSLRRLLTVLR